MNHKASPSDQAYLQSFLNCTIDPNAFHHKEHLRLAYTLLCQHPVDEAFDILKQGILKLLSHLGAGPDKYHETITMAWLLIVKHHMEKSASCETFNNFLEQNGVLMGTEIIKKHYSDEQLGSKQAKQTFVEPDIDDIPGYAP